MEGDREGSGGCSPLLAASPPSCPVPPLYVELEVAASSEAGPVAEGSADGGESAEGRNSEPTEVSPMPVPPRQSPLLPPFLDGEEAKEVTVEDADGGGLPVVEASASAPADILKRSDENLPTDKFMLKYVKKNREGYVFFLIFLAVSVPIAVVSADGKRVRRLHPLPAPDAEDRRVHALVEYETPDAAERAVAVLNDEKNWRSGMRVELLLKRMEKFGLISRVRRPGAPPAEKTACDGPAVGEGLGPEGPVEAAGLESNDLLGSKPYMLSSSEGEESDVELMVNPNGDLELPTSKDKRETPEAALTVAAHRIATLRDGQINFLVHFHDSMAPYLHHWGYLYVPLVHWVRIHQVFREGPSMHSSKKGAVTMGGLFFIPIGVLVAGTTTGFSSAVVFGSGAITFVFLVIGLLDDALNFVKNRTYGLPRWIKLMLQVAGGACFSFWFCVSEMSSRYNMYALLANIMEIRGSLPQPLGLVYLGKFYLPLITFCFVSMGNGVNLTDGLDGLAGGTSALAFIGMSVAVLPINPELSIFGASMAGACVGFLFHNRYKASVFMGYTGSLALGGALAAMAACTGMFFPLLICSGTFVLEVSSMIVQTTLSKIQIKVCCCRASKLISGTGQSFFQTTPFHRHLEFCGFKETSIVACFYILSSILCLVAGYVGLSSA
ncbi:unnamed protein product [Spirodela intermedia]|uniref:HTH La-type RNA-binding domain-containing protein n=1 Tax=Spirodela intermedia TaxID=51605 RepID=A0A7I8ITP4_SPIIN|nr:unnamed protein product [Spirodela intermedia]CAA6661365.1 unnamed protein product [Spirodela intermedia]